MRWMRSVFASPRWLQVSPASIDAIDAVAHRNAVAHVALAGAHPDDGGIAGEIAIAPIAATGWSSKSGFQVRPPLADFQTPPVAAPT